MTSSPFRPDLFAGRVALLTGGGTGITRGIAEALAAHGADTVLVSRKEEHVNAASEVIARSYRTRSLGIAADVRQADAMEAVARRAVEEYGRLDILVNGAAGNFPCPSADLTPNGFSAVIDIDAKGTWHASRAAFHAWMKDHG